jgi:ATP-dependent RNA helicase DDX24/MAK5
MNDLPWRSVKGPRKTDLGEDMLEVEEVEDVEVIYEETAAGRVAKFRVRLIRLTVFSIFI